MLKLLKKLSSNHLVLVISGLVLLYAFYNYSNNKSLSTDGLHNRNGGSNLAGSGSACGSNYSAGTNNLAGNSGPASVSGVQTSGGALPQACAR